MSRSAAADYVPDPRVLPPTAFWQSKAYSARAKRAKAKLWAECVEAYCDALAYQEAQRISRGGRPAKAKPAPAVRESEPARPVVRCLGYGDVACEAERRDPRHPRCKACSRRAGALAREAKGPRKRWTPRAAVCACGAPIVPHGRRGALRERCEPCREVRHRELARASMRKLYEKRKAA